MTEVLVVDDSQFMRTVLASVLDGHGYDVRTASDGETAIEAAIEHEPDVITMDVQMPGVDGIEAVERIMARRPTPILVLSAHTRDGADATLDALESGAIDVLPKPTGEVTANVESFQAEFLAAVEAVADADTHPRSVTWERAAAAARTAADAEARVREASAAVAQCAGGAGTRRGGSSTHRGGAAAGNPVRLDGSRPNAGVPPSLDASPTIVIGASTGGPRLVEQVLTELPADLDARVLVVQHMPESFTERLARRLDEVSDYDVREADDGARVRPGEALVAKGGYHAEVDYAGAEHLRVALTEDEPVHGVRPSIDVTMSSAAEHVDDPLVGVALSGMGKDGADGIREIAAAGGATLAQDADTAPVSGIPRHAVETGAVDRVCTPDEIADGIVQAVADLAAGRTHDARADEDPRTDRRSDGGERR